MGDNPFPVFGSCLDFQGPFRSTREIILASASPRRQALLASLGISFHVIPARFREPDPEPGRPPQEHALFLAREKAGEVAAKKNRAVVIGADTIVVHRGTIMGKPESDAHALEMLGSLQGSIHQVITAVSIMCLSLKFDKNIVCSTQVEMVRAGDEILARYIRTREPEDKAGAYAIQGLGGFLVKSVHGSYSNVVGLPLAEVWTCLLEQGYLRVSQEQAGP